MSVKCIFNAHRSEVEPILELRTLDFMLFVVPAAVG